MVAVQLLIVDDSEDDAVLIGDALLAAGIEVSYHRVQTAAAVSAALRAGSPDLVICDYRMPGFSAEEALELVRAGGLDIPFILVSGYIGEDAAVAMMRAGVRDFARKDSPHHLVSIVQRELQELENRRQRRRAEEALRISEAHFRLLAEHAQDVLFRCRVGPPVEVVYLSPAAAAVTGYPEAELLGAAHHVLDHIADAGERAAFEQSWCTGADMSLVVRWGRPDGSTAWLEQRASAVRERGKLVAVEGVLRDITERMLAEREREVLVYQLEQAERIESLGVLAGGVAHDFNNALAVIHGSATLLAEDLGPTHPSRPDVDRILDAAERSAALTKQLLLFARREPERPETFDVNTLLADLEDLIRRMIGEDVDVVCEPGADENLVTIDRNKLEQIVLNLVANSRSAMPAGGSLSIDSSRLTLAGAGEVDVPDGCYVRLRVTDTGTGMTPEVLKHAFDPFFTTKGAGEGTGLGLSIAHGVIRLAGGSIALSSVPGDGTTVEVYLPAAESKTATDAAAPTAARAAQGNAEIILLVEDEDPVRDVVARILTRHHYVVVAVGSPAEALRVCAAGRDYRVDLLLTDLIMPGMSGFELAERLCQDRPDMPVVYMSGYSGERSRDDRVGHLGRDRRTGAKATLLRKPFSTSSLLAGLRKGLDGRLAAGAVPDGVEGEVEDRPLVDVAFGPDPTAVAVDDAPDACQAHAGTGEVVLGAGPGIGAGTRRPARRAHARRAG